MTYSEFKALLEIYKADLAYAETNAARWANSSDVCAKCTAEHYLKYMQFRITQFRNTRLVDYK